MTCRRCTQDAPLSKQGWCVDCERAYDTWVRRHASDIVWQALAGTVVIAFGGLVLPLLGLGPLIAALGVFAGFGTLYGSHRAMQHHRRRQFLQGPLPRAYLRD